MGGEFSKGQIIKLDEWFTLSTTPKIEFFGTGFQSTEYQSRKKCRFIYLNIY